MCRTEIKNVYVGGTTDRRFTAKSDQAGPYLVQEALSDVSATQIALAEKEQMSMSGVLRNYAGLYESQE